MSLNKRKLKEDEVVDEIIKKLRTMQVGNKEQRREFLRALMRLSKVSDTVARRVFKSIGKVLDDLRDDGLINNSTGENESGKIEEVKGKRTLPWKKALTMRGF